MSTSRMTLLAVVIVVVSVLSGCKCVLRSDLDANARGSYQPTYEIPPQVVDLHVAWRVATD